MNESIKSCKMCDQPNDGTVRFTNNNLCKDCHYKKYRNKDREKELYELKKVERAKRLETGNVLICACGATESETVFFKDKKCGTCRNEITKNRIKNGLVKKKEIVNPKTCSCGNIQSVDMPFVSGLCNTCYNRQMGQKQHIKDRAKIVGKIYKDKNRAIIKEKNKAYRERTKDRIVEYRKENRVKYILIKSKEYDKKKGYENDLTIEFIEGIICCGCAYCGATHLKMSLDRIDNNIGHTKNNVMPSCLNCNLFRGNMPYEGWLVILPYLNECIDNGLLYNFDWKDKLNINNKKIKLLREKLIPKRVKGTIYDKKYSGRAKHILSRARSFLNNYGLMYDVNLDFIENMISQPCKYCGDTKSLMTLDRIDNNLGYLKNNVNQSCLHCNCFRKDLPYDTWVLMTPGVKEAFELGLLAGWSISKIKKV